MTIADSPTTYLYTDFDSASDYGFIFKGQADVDIDDLNMSNIRYSEGILVEV